jgi:tRNA(adenine34) deaminase
MEAKLCACGCGRPLDRRAALVGLTCVGVGAALASTSPARAEALLTPAQPQDEGFMRLALAEAAKGDFPFGAVIVRDGKVVATGHNRGSNDPTAHGEMVAIHAFVARHPSGLLREATLYTSGEPCPMCMSAIIWCGFRRMVYAASIAELATRIGQIMLTSAEVANRASFTKIEITGGVLSKEAMALFR